ncbi:MAG: RnfABCDGE type electron transport complex subunit G [Desulfobacterales bacterium]|nr:RnfABCDGE type electron transport complex subunit G [Desulfobacterales bacterium]
MREMIKMILVLTVLSLASGGLLAALRNKTSDKIEYNELSFVKGPAITTIMKGVSNNPLADRFKIKDDKSEKSFFVGILNGKPNTVAFESFGKGFGGKLGVVVGVNMDDDKIVGVGVTTHSETPGVGSRAKSDPTFVSQFKGQPLIETFKVKSDGGKVDAISGATLTSRGVSTALTDAGALYKRLKPQVVEKLKGFVK